MRCANERYCNEHALYCVARLYHLFYESLALSTLNLHELVMVSELANEKQSVSGQENAPVSVNGQANVSAPESENEKQSVNDHGDDLLQPQSASASAVNENVPDAVILSDHGDDEDGRESRVPSWPIGCGWCRR